MFCHNLRRRSSYAPILDTLISRSTFGLRESQLTTHDLALPLASEVEPKTGLSRVTRHLRVLLLSPFSVSDEQKVEDTLERIQRFTSFSAEPIVIVFLLDPPKAIQSARNVAIQADKSLNDQDGIAAGGICAYSTLQAELLNHAFPAIPILLLPKLEGLPDLLKSHLAVLTQPALQPPPDPNATIGLLGVCASAMSNPEAANYLHDHFTSIPEIAETCTNTQSLNSSSPTNLAAFAQQVLAQTDLLDGDQMQIDHDLNTAQGKMMAIKNLAGEEQTTALIDFWRSEWEID